MLNPITLEEARRLMKILCDGGAMTEDELWSLIDYLAALAPRPKLIALPQTAADAPDAA